MFLKRSGKAIALVPLLFAAGCSTVSDGMSKVGSSFSNFVSADHESIKIDSDPSGATVYVMGEKVGVTPMTISQKLIFPMQYDRSKESLYGKVTLKKGGCADLEKPVSAKMMAEGYKATLDCGDLTPASSAMGNTRGAVRTVPIPRLSENLEQRLARIKDMQEKGLISEDEAKAARARVLGDL